MSYPPHTACNVVHTCLSLGFTHSFPQLLIRSFLEFMHASSLLRTLQWLLSPLKPLMIWALRPLSPCWGRPSPLLTVLWFLLILWTRSSFPSWILLPWISAWPVPFRHLGLSSELPSSEKPLQMALCIGLHPPALSPSLNFSPGYSLYTHDLSLSEITLFALFAHAPSLLPWNVSFMRAGQGRVFLLASHTKIYRRNKRMSQQFAY